MNLRLIKKVRRPMLTVFFTAGIIGFSHLTALASDVVAQEPILMQEVSKELKQEGGSVFPLGNPNVTYEKYFSGKSYVALLSNQGVPVYSVTFAKGAHTYWHIHHQTCQVLLGEAGRGYYQIWGEPAKKIHPGETVIIPAGVKHWHGAEPDSVFQHVVIMEPIQESYTEWLEPVNVEMYSKLQ